VTWILQDFVVLYISIIDEEKVLNKQNRKEDDPFSYYYNFEEVTVDFISWTIVFIQCRPEVYRERIK